MGVSVTSTTVSYNGVSMKVENGKIFMRAFGTTISNHSMHWSWQEVAQKDLKKEVVDHLKEAKLL